MLISIEIRKKVCQLQVLVSMLVNGFMNICFSVVNVDSSVQWVVEKCVLYNLLSRVMKVVVFMLFVKLFRLRVNSSRLFISVVCLRCMISRLKVGMVIEFYVLVFLWVSVQKFRLDISCSMLKFSRVCDKCRCNRKKLFMMVFMMVINRLMVLLVRFILVWLKFMFFSRNGVDRLRVNVLLILYSIISVRNVLVLCMLKQLCSEVLRVWKGIQWVMLRLMVIVLVIWLIMKVSWVQWLLLFGFRLISISRQCIIYVLIVILVIRVMNLCSLLLVWDIGVVKCVGRCGISSRVSIFILIVSFVIIWYICG